MDRKSKLINKKTRPLTANSAFLSPIKHKFTISTSPLLDMSPIDTINAKKLALSNWSPLLTSPEANNKLEANIDNKLESNEDINPMELLAKRLGKSPNSTKEMLISEDVTDFEQIINNNTLEETAIHITNNNNTTDIQETNKTEDIMPVKTVKSNISDTNDNNSEIHSSLKENQSTNSLNQKVENTKKSPKKFGNQSRRIHCRRASLVCSADAMKAIMAMKSPTNQIKSPKRKLDTSANQSKLRQPKASLLFI